ncbi:MAG: TetR/AcrR family transcriptional regulator [Megasphaera sp.]|nr:TetR/AcrR family transcriptional regulator [Megasphaera sp.]MCH4187696.1 TetR/AcrR family transcriptional regulator [Megasphaera sp.]MCH4217595.1 TetR/AcrR family transcriptional regulator [Megasphaera sp.]
MSRPPLKEEEKRKVTARLIQATQEIIFSDGLDTVTIRKIANIAKVNSAVLYKYFRDLDELILFASTDLLKEYTADLIKQNARQAAKNPSIDYLLSWKLFCRYSFQYPECMRHLFFGKHSDDLSRIIRSYYDLFSEQLEGLSISLQAMLRSGDIYAHNLEVLRPLFTGRMSEKRVQLINDLTVAYYHKLLDDRIAAGNDADIETLTNQMLYACRQILVLSYGFRNWELFRLNV